MDDIIHANKSAAKSACEQYVAAMRDLQASRRALVIESNSRLVPVGCAELFDFMTTPLDDTHQMLIVNAACHAIAMNQETERMAIGERMRPSTLYRPQLSRDGDQWCALYGENLHDGVAGFGNSPDGAMRDFDVAWFRESNAHSSPDQKSRLAQGSGTPN